MDEATRLAAYFASVSRDLSADAGDPVTFERVARRAVQVVTPVDFCGITLRTRRGSAVTVGSTEPVAEELDDLQYRCGEGPCLDAAFERENCLIDDMATETRWPTWTPEARARGVGSMYAIRLHTETETLGALNMYSWRPRAFDAESVDLAAIFGAHAAEALSKAKLISGLQSALESRHLIGMAQGVLAQRYSVTYETAFEVLRRYSNDTNTKLRDVARLVVDLRELPPRDEHATVVRAAARVAERDSGETVGELDPLA